MEQIEKNKENKLIQERKKLIKNRIYSSPNTPACLLYYSIINPQPIVLNQWWSPDITPHLRCDASTHFVILSIIH
jgi:hypothetical protein